MRNLVLILGLVLATNCLLADVSGVKMTGEQRNGTLSFDDEQVRYFAGEYKGTFSHDGCLEGARAVHKLHADQNKSLITNKRFNFQLAHNHRFFVIGENNLTTKEWTWYCINISADGNSMKFYVATNTRLHESNGWVKPAAKINGYDTEIGFADDDDGGIGYYVTTP